MIAFKYSIHLLTLILPISNQERYIEDWVLILSKFPYSSQNIESKS